MSRILVDTSVWIDYFTDARLYPVIDRLIGENQICTNDLILAELVPFIQMQKQYELIEALRALQKHEIRIDWEKITQFQVANLSRGRTNTSD
jgi:predicted nucleic acid-binding protein